MYATDIAPRCVLFAEFNRQLNGDETWLNERGALYEPVEGLKFDLITLPSPVRYLASSKKYIYA